MTEQLSCPVCGGHCTLLDVVDFNRSCGKHLPLSGIPVYYTLCEQCGFCFAPELYTWSIGDFESRIYNSEYVEVDPDYVELRPRTNARSLLGLIGSRAVELSHLDYGGGKGLLSELLCQSGWRSTSYDPFIDRGVAIEDLGRFDLITAFEVFEHVPDVVRLMSDLSALLAKSGVVLFSTLLSDGNLAPRQRITWWYASPRNGHISLFSKKSLFLLADRWEFRFGSFSEGFHAFWKDAPDWARHFIRAA